MNKSKKYVSVDEENYNKMLQMLGSIEYTLSCEDMPAALQNERIKGMISTYYHFRGWVPIWEVNDEK